MYGARLAGVEQATGTCGHVSRWMRRFLDSGLQIIKSVKRLFILKNLENSVFQGFSRGGCGGQNGVRVHPGNYLCIP